MKRLARLVLVLALLCVAALAMAAPTSGQEVRIRDLTLGDGTIPVRLLGYGVVTGLDGSGDRGGGGRNSGHTVQSVANLLRRFDVVVPAELLRTPNVAAVLVTAEVSPYLRAGGRFEVHVSSLGDARSLRGGVLWMTPLVSDAGAAPVATAQGPLLLSEGAASRGNGYTVETVARIPNGGLIEGDLPRPAFASTSRLLLREPDLGTATRIAAAINATTGEGSAKVEDPGAVALTFPQGDADRATALSRIYELKVRPERPARVVIDGRDGTVVAGGELTVGEAVVSHSGLTLSVGSSGEAPGAQGNVRVPTGTSVQQVASALQAVQTQPAEIAAIFESLREVGAISAEVVIR